MHYVVEFVYIRFTRYKISRDCIKSFIFGKSRKRDTFLYM